MDKEQQAKIDEQLEKGNRDPDAYRPRVVASSDAPVLSESWLLEEDSQTVIVEIHLIGSKSLSLEKFQVGVVRGLTLLQTIAIQEAVEAFPVDPKLLAPGYKHNAAEKAALQARHDVRRRATVVQAIVDPETEVQMFSYNGEGAGMPIEERSEALVKVLHGAYESVNVPGRQAVFLNRFPDVGRDTGEGTGTGDVSDGQDVRSAANRDHA